jgi:hypothetical protein
VPIDTTEPQSPGWWIKRLSRKLNSRQARLELLHSHYRGDPPLPRAHEGQREIFRRFVKNARINYAKLIAEAPRHRMICTGVVTGEDEADALLAEWWIKNGMPVETAEVHRSMLSLGDGYAMIGWDDVDGIPTVTHEDPRQCITEHDPVRQRRRLAGLKIFHDDVAEMDVAYLFLPGRRYVAYKSTRATTKNVMFRPTAWDWKEDAGGEEGEFVPGNVVPLVRFRNERGVAEFEDHLGHLDRINDDLLHRMTISSLQAFRQRAVKGVPTHYPDNHPDANLRGKEIDYGDVFPADPGAMWLLPLTAELWESGAIDITPLISASKYDAQQLSAVTFTPLSYLQPDAAQGSAEGASAQRENLVFKVEDRIQRATDGWAEVASIQLAFWYAETGRDLIDTPPDAKPQWMPPERHSLAERHDANVKAKAGDVPWKTRMLKVLQFTPDEVAEMEAERMDDALLFPELTAVTAAQPPATEQPAPAPADEAVPVA